MASIPNISPSPMTAPKPRSSWSSRPARKRKDRKSTRLNSSHSQISYAVFCLKKKKHNAYPYYLNPNQTHHPNPRNNLTPYLTHTHHCHLAPHLYIPPSHDYTP